MSELDPDLGGLTQCFLKVVFPLDTKPSRAAGGKYLNVIDGARC